MSVGGKGAPQPLLSSFPPPFHPILPPSSQLPVVLLSFSPFRHLSFSLSLLRWSSAARQVSAQAKPTRRRTMTARIASSLRALLSGAMSVGGKGAQWKRAAAATSTRAVATTAATSTSTSARLGREDDDVTPVSSSSQRDQLGRVHIRGEAMRDFKGNDPYLIMKNCVKALNRPLAPPSQRETSMEWRVAAETLFGLGALAGDAELCVEALVTLRAGGITPSAAHGSKFLSCLLRWDNEKGARRLAALVLHGLLEGNDGRGGGIPEALRFDGVDSIFVNSVLAVCAKYGLKDKAWRVFDTYFEDDRFKPTHVTLATMIRVNNGSGEDIIRAWRKLEKYLPLIVEHGGGIGQLKVYESLTVELSKVGDVDRARRTVMELFKLSPPPYQSAQEERERQSHLVVGANAFLSCLSKECAEKDKYDRESVEEVLAAMRKAECSPTDATLHSVLVCVPRSGGSIPLSEEVLQKFRKMKVEPTVQAYNIILNQAASEGAVAEMRRVFSQMTREGFVPNRVTFNTLAKGYAKAGRSGDALKSIQHAIRAGIKLDDASSIAVAKACIEHIQRRPGDEAAVEKVLVAVGSLLGRSQLPSTAASTSLFIQAFGMAGMHDRAVRMFNDAIVRENVAGPIKTRYYNAILASFAHSKRVDHLQTTKKFFDEAVKMELADTTTYNIMLSSLLHRGMMDDATGLLETLKMGGLGADTITYNTLIKHEKVGGNLEAAQQWMTEMVRAGVQPNGSTLRLLVPAYLERGDVDSAANVLRQLRVLGVGVPKGLRQAWLSKLPSIPPNSAIRRELSS
uniref:Pentacotripeptide-repeat region of PRORP domain-containing protein n=1 Tax=Palpitomonas bilix TaxID=652834 RepID=A0A7S3CZY3_9EUKA|mmetsp:Transcript_16352/g.41470  ORF Transcript_16352/g.41470 Transcript_16352/m.41470 type:complete len:796 (+) Transcript_16352:1-2388(+)